MTSYNVKQETVTLEIGPVANGGGKLTNHKRILLGALLSTIGAAVIVGAGTIIGTTAGSLSKDNNANNNIEPSLAIAPTSSSSINKLAMQATPIATPNPTPKSGLSDLECLCKYLVILHADLNDWCSRIISSGDINARDSKRASVLIYVADLGCCDVMPLLLSESEIDVNARLAQISSSLTALMLIATHGFNKCAEQLLMSPSMNVYLQNTYGRTARDLAVFNGRSGIVTLIDAYIANHPTTAIASATPTPKPIATPTPNPSLSDLECLCKYLVILHADLNDWCSRIISSGDINARDSNQYTVLIASAETGYCDVIPLLLSEPGIDVNARLLLNNYNQTALIRAVVFFKTECVKQLLMSPSINVYLQDTNGHTARYKAIFNEHSEILSLIDAYIANHPTTTSSTITVKPTPNPTNLPSGK